MPIYEYRCNSCGGIQEELHSITKTPDIFCKVCESDTPMERIISDNRAGFSIKGDTPTKLYKEKRLRHRKNADLEVRQIDRWGSGPKLAPNVAGQRTETWAEATALAKEAGIDTKTYEAYAEQEKHMSSGGIDDRKWAAAKENQRKS